MLTASTLPRRFRSSVDWDWLRAAPESTREKISHRERKRLRDWLLQSAMSAVSHNESFRQSHHYYTTRATNLLKKMQSLTVIACKLLRIIFMIFKKGIRFDPEKMMRDIIYPTLQEAVA